MARCPDLLGDLDVVARREGRFIHALHAAIAAVAFVGALLTVSYLGSKIERMMRLEPAVAAVSG